MHTSKCNDLVFVLLMLMLGALFRIANGARVEWTSLNNSVTRTDYLLVAMPLSTTMYFSA
jgi:hypothetical protein